MKAAAVVLVLVCACAGAGAQGLPSQSLTKGTWDLAIMAGGGPTVPGGVEDAATFTGEFRVGKILTEEHGSGWLRGNLEMAIDFVPVKIVTNVPDTVYAGGFTPFNLKWNFTSGKRIAPYVQLSSGLLFSSEELPAGTSNVNFSSGVSVGMHIFTKEKRAITLETRYRHVSNSGLADLNPGMNVVQFMIGYNWFK